MKEQRKLKIAWFSVLNLPNRPQEEKESLSAYFSEHVLPELKNKFDITVYHNSFERYQDYKTFHYLKAFEHNKQDAFDIFFYQLEDDSRSNFVRSHMGLIPGITYFHHFNLTNYGPEPLLNSPYSDIVDKFNTDGNDWPDRKNKYKPKGPAAFREAALSLVSIFSSSHNLDEFKRQVKTRLKQSAENTLDAFYLPYPVNNQIMKVGNKDEPDVFKIAFVGSTRIENRAHKVLSAISKLKNPYKLFWMLDKNELPLAKDLLEEFGISDVKLCGNVNAETWEQITDKSDCAVHTLFSVYGHNEPFLGISMSSGLPSIVTNFASTETLPDNLVYKIQPGDRESLEMTEVMNSIQQGHSKFESQELMKYCKEVYDSKQVALELASIFIKRKEYLTGMLNSWKKLESDALKSLLAESDGLLDQDNPTFRAFIEPALQELGWTA